MSDSSASVIKSNKWNKVGCETSEKTVEFEVELIDNRLLNINGWLSIRCVEIESKHGNDVSVYSVIMSHNSAKNLYEFLNRNL